MEANRYPLMKTRLPARVNAYIDELDQNGQIDRDDDNFPYVISAEHQKESGVIVWRVRIVRNGKDALFILNPRSRQEPMINWNPNDGYVRKERPEAKADVSSDGKRRERALRTESAGKVIVDQILQG